MTYDPYTTLSNLIAICTYLHLRCPLSNRYGYFFKRMMCFSIDLKDAYLPIPVKDHCHFMISLETQT